MYKLIRSILFILNPEHSHYIAMHGLRLAHKIGLTKLIKKSSFRTQHFMGLEFPNRVGIAAGLDKNAEYVDALADLGFGFIEVGTVTPKAQVGNPRPRLFRLIEQEAIINRMGFNNKGVDYVADQLAKTKYRGILGINIGKNKDTPLEHAIDDYLICFRQLWKYASYITINISSPNTPGLRDLHQGDLLTSLLTTLKQEQKLIHDTHNKYVPLVVKLSPDLTDETLREIAFILLEQKIDGVIATNTTIYRDGAEDSPYKNETGGLSGRPLCQRSTRTIERLHAILEDNIPIIASGGIMDATSATEKLAAGARLLQVYTGFIYAGPAILSQILQKNR